MSNLLIIGAGTYADVAHEIAVDMGCFKEIAFVDDCVKQTPNGAPVIGTVNEIDQLKDKFSNVIVAIGNPEIRLPLLEKLENEKKFRITKLISPHAYISSNVVIEKGCIIEPMAVVHTRCKLLQGCIISAGAVVNHASICESGVHVDCNATVAGYSTVPMKTKVHSGTVFKEKE